jgi:putative flavoprotein involved in K+ transport
VLVVGASASGVQLAAEFRTAGRDVILAVGRHTRLPRAYRGRDIHWWLDRLGVLRRPVGERGEARQDRHHSSAQLTGRAGRDVDLGTLRRAGVTLVGRLVDIDGARARFAGDLPRDAADADDRLARLLSRIDEHIATAERDRAHAPGTRPPRVRPGDPLRELDLAAAGIGTIVWATGYRRSYPWLRVPVLDPDGELVHRGGVTPAPGLYALGLPLQSRVNSTFIDGVGHDAAAIAGHIARRSRHRAA